MASRRNSGFIARWLVTLYLGHSRVYCSGQKPVLLLAAVSTPLLYTVGIWAHPTVGSGRSLASRLLWTIGHSLRPYSRPRRKRVSTSTTLTGNTTAALL